MSTNLINFQSYPPSFGPASHGATQHEWSPLMSWSLYAYCYLYSLQSTPCIWVVLRRIEMKSRTRTGSVVSFQCPRSWALDIKKLYTAIERLFRAKSGKVLENKKVAKRIYDMRSWKFQRNHSWLFVHSMGFAFTWTF